MDKRYDPLLIFSQTMMTFQKKPTILIEIKGTKDEYFIILSPGTILRGVLASPGKKKVLKTGDHLFENRDLLGKVIVKCDGKETPFPDYNEFLKHIAWI